MLADYQRMSTTGLIDTLATLTQEYTQLLGEKRFGDRYDEVKKMIQQIQAVIEARKEINTLSRETGIT